MARPKRLLVGILISVGIGATSFLVRAPSLDEALTIDERLWLFRSQRFVASVADVRFGDAIETGHPGVTTMWIAGLAQRTLPADSDLRARYVRARLGIAVASSALIVLVWWLVGALAGPLAAAFAGLLLALDPFLMAHGRVVHLDGLLALLMVSSALALIAALRTDSTKMLVLSGALGGLALLTKQPAVFLPLVVIVALWVDGRGIRARFTRWLLPAAVVGFVLWPVLWVRPWHAIGLMAGGGGAAVSETNSGGFFLGRRVGHPGPLFYPVAFALRSSELILPAFAVTALWAVRRRARDEAARTVRLLLAFTLGFALLLTLAPKKGDRYLLPGLVAVDVAVALGAAQLLRGKTKLVLPIGAVALALHGAPAIALNPYQLAHFNWVTGGPTVAQRAMVVGWGEGLDEAAEALNGLPGASQMTVATTRMTQFEDFFVGRSVRVEDSSLVRPGGPLPDLVLFYASSVQVGRVPAVWAAYRDRTPIYRLEVNGIPYVRVYRVE